MSTSHLDAVLFDLDGVLFDTEPLHRLAWIETMRAFGESIDDEFLMPWTGIPCIDLATYFEKNLSPQRDRSVYHTKKGETFRRIVHTDLRAYDQVPDLISRLSIRLDCGFVTSNDRIDAELMLDVSGYSGVLTTGVTYDEVDRHKPEPDPYLKAASIIGAEPARCIVVEDSPSGVASARAAGMEVIAVTTSFPPEELSAAHHRFGSTAEACKLILRMS